MDTNPYRVPEHLPVTTSDPYLVAWADLRRRRSMMWASFIALPIVALSAHLFPHTSAVLVPTLWASVLFAIGRVQLYSCPRCQDLYAMRDWLVGSADMLVTNTCKHCGLKMGTAQKSSSAR
jgi:hypothetical protein